MRGTFSLFYPIRRQKDHTEYFALYDLLLSYAPAAKSEEIIIIHR